MTSNVPILKSSTKMKLEFKKTPVLLDKTLHEAFDINKKRMNELIELIADEGAYVNLFTPKLPEVLQKCQTIEEYSYICILIGRFLSEEHPLKNSSDQNDTNTPESVLIPLNHA